MNEYNLMCQKRKCQMCLFLLMCEDLKNADLWERNKNDSMHDTKPIKKTKTM